MRKLHKQTRKEASMSGRGTTKNQQMPTLKAFDEANDLLMGILQSQKPGNDLIQNCDLPPPMKVFSKSDNTAVISNLIRKNISTLTDFNHQEEIKFGDNQIGVMKALRLSQTRAREAEAKCASIGKEMDSLLVAFMEESMQIFGYRQIMMLLEFQVSQLQKQQRHCCDCEKRLSDMAIDDGNHSNGVNWMTTWALCLGVAGFGIAIGCKFHLFRIAAFLHWKH